MLPSIIVKIVFRNNLFKRYSGCQSHYVRFNGQRKALVYIELDLHHIGIGISVSISEITANHANDNH